MAYFVTTPSSNICEATPNNGVKVGGGGGGATTLSFILFSVILICYFYNLDKYLIYEFFMILSM